MIVEPELQAPEPELPPVALPARYNYVAAFLTLACNMNCPYCITSHGRNGHRKRRTARTMSGEDWIAALNRVRVRPGLPVTLQGGEPSLHPDFLQIIQGIRPDTEIDVLTNLRFDVREFAAAVPPERLRRNAPYASIRVSYHPDATDLPTMAKKVVFLQERGYSIGVWAIRHPGHEAEIRRADGVCTDMGIDFRTKEYLGFYRRRLYGTYRYPGAVGSSQTNDVLCRGSELLIGPSGDVFRCHANLYGERNALDHILNPRFRIRDTYLPCGEFGSCNPCDVKIKTDRFQRDGHTSVEIKPPGGAATDGKRGV